jgi:multidrug resistance efflux pump
MGSFIKIPQRIPIRIKNRDSTVARVSSAAGMSVETTTHPVA